MSGEHHSPEPANTSLGLERLVFFSDAVMAIAITLLALDLRVPNLPPESAAAELPGQLRAIAPRFASMVISFFVIGIYWLAHHRYFEHVRRYDRRLILINLAFLLFIVCVPFATSLLGSYPMVPLVYVIYALTAAGMGFSMLGVWAYATHRHRLVDPRLDSRLVRQIALSALFAPLLFLISIPFALVSPLYAISIWCISPAATALASRWIARAPVARQPQHRAHSMHH